MPDSGKLLRNLTKRPQPAKNCDLLHKKGLVDAKQLKQAYTQAKIITAIVIITGQVYPQADAKQAGACA